MGQRMRRRSWTAVQSQKDETHRSSKTREHDLDIDIAVRRARPVHPDSASENEARARTTPGPRTLERRVYSRRRTSPNPFDYSTWKGPRPCALERYFSLVCARVSAPCTSYLYLVPIQIHGKSSRTCPGCQWPLGSQTSVLAPLCVVLWLLTGGVMVAKGLTSFSREANAS
jgi:hypothetical protein